jgi:hypothetical protein
VAVLVEAEHALLAHQRLHLRSLREAVLDADAVVGLHLATQAGAASAPSTALLLILQKGLMPKATEGQGGTASKVCHQEEHASEFPVPTRHLQNPGFGSCSGGPTCAKYR